MKRLTLDEFLDKLQTKVMYLYSEGDDVAVKSDPATEVYLVKFRGEQPFESTYLSKFVNNAIMGQEELTKKQYDNF